MSKYAMIDLETLSLRPDAAVIAIGVVIFDDNEIIESKGWSIDMKQVTGHVDPKTVHFWMQPECDGAREGVFNGQYAPFTVAFELKTLLAQHNVSEVWANDPHFDYVILREWWARTAVSSPVGEFPIHYRAPRSFKTLMGEAERLGHDVRSTRGQYVAHDPVEDAASQARAVIAVRKMLS